MFAALHQLKCLNKQCYWYVLNLTHSETLGQAGICRRNNKWSLFIRFYLHVNEFSLSWRWNRLQAFVWKMRLLLGGKCLFCATALAVLYCSEKLYMHYLMWFCWPMPTLCYEVWLADWMFFPLKICRWIKTLKLLQSCIFLWYIFGRFSQYP